MSDRIAVMNGGRVEQIGSPREIYEHPETAFVADFIGSLNALDLVIDELLGTYAVSRFGEGQRVVVPVASDYRTGDTVRVAVRPSGCRSRRPTSPYATRVRARTIAEIVSEHMSIPRRHPRRPCVGHRLVGGRSRAEATARHVLGRSTPRAGRLATVRSPGWPAARGAGRRRQCVLNLGRMTTISTRGRDHRHS